MNLDEGSFCFNGEIDGFALFASASTVANESLKTNAWWDAQIYDSSNRVVTLIGTDDSEITAGEITEYSPKRGFKVQTSKTSAEYMLKFKDTECARKTLDPLNGQTFYALFFTTSNYIQGIPATNTTTKAVKSNMSVSKEYAEGVNLIVVKFTFALDFEMLYTEIQMEEGFTSDEISGLTGVYLDPVSCTQTVITTTAFDCSKTALEGLALANFTVYNITDDPTKTTPIVPSGVVPTANSYAITIASQDAGDSLFVEIATPSASNLYVTGKSVTQTAV
jgi:hypothetical protein